MDFDEYVKTIPWSLLLMVSMENLQRGAKKLNWNSHFFVDDWSPATETVVLFLQIAFAMSIERKDDKSPEAKKFMGFIEMLTDYLKGHLDQ